MSGDLVFSNYTIDNDANKTLGFEGYHNFIWAAGFWKRSLCLHIYPTPATLYPVLLSLHRRCLRCMDLMVKLRASLRCSGKKGYLHGFLPGNGCIKIANGVHIFTDGASVPLAMCTLFSTGSRYRHLFWPFHAQSFYNKGRHNTIHLACWQWCLI